MPDDAAAMLRTASPPGENQTNPATAGDGPTLSDATRDTIAAARAMIGVNKKPTSRWTPYKATGTQPPDALRNPHYDPNAAAKALELLAELPDMPLSEPESATARLVEADR